MRKHSSHDTPLINNGESRKVSISDFVVPRLTQINSQPNGEVPKQAETTTESYSKDINSSNSINKRNSIVFCIIFFKKISNNTCIR